MAKDEKTGGGYGRPPVHTQFQPGKSGNSRGRPKASKDLQARLKKAAAEKVVVQEAGRERKVDKLDVALTQMMNKAAQGQPSFLKMALTQIQKAEAAEPTATPQEELAEADHEVIALVISRIRQQGSHA
jgi:Family of unknown function (DUF5681)